jgi:hypothetical protein
MPRKRTRNEPSADGQKRRWWFLTCSTCKGTLRWYGLEHEDKPMHRCVGRTIAVFDRQAPASDPGRANGEFTPVVVRGTPPNQPLRL